MRRWLTIFVLSGCGPTFESNCGPAGCAVPSASETCGNALDDDGDGSVDEGCACAGHESRVCEGVGRCTRGTQTCVGGADEFLVWSECEGPTGPFPEVCNGEDDDCDGMTDEEACPVDEPPPPAPLVTMVEVSLDHDCATVMCPAEAPYPIACDVDFSQGDPRGCIALIEEGGATGLYFQAGDQCNEGWVEGTMTCSSVPGDPLDEDSCPINKDVPIYGQSPAECPEVND